MIRKIEGAIVGVGFGYSVGKFANFATDFASRYYDNIPSEVAKAAIFTGATGLGILVGHEYYNSKKLAKIYGHD